MSPGLRAHRVLKRIAAEAGVSFLTVIDWHWSGRWNVKAVWARGVTRYGREAMDRMHIRLRAAQIQGELQ